MTLTRHKPKSRWSALTGIGCAVAAAIVALSLSSPLSAAENDQPRISEPGHYQGYSKEIYPDWKRTAFYLPVRDGTRLAVTVYRPAENGKPVTKKLPVLFAFTPYHARTNEANGTVSSRVEQSPNSRPMVEMTHYGYVVVSVDVRGKGASFGRRLGFQDQSEAQDGYDMVEWLAKQPWSDGQVAMWGCSYVGGEQYRVAATAPPHLKAIFPGCADFDKYLFVSRGGITAQFNTRSEDPVAVDGPTVPMDEDPTGVLLRQAVAEHAANTKMAETWRGMPFRDSVSPTFKSRYWEEVSATSYIDVIRKSGIAIYKWGNWHDEGGIQALLADANLTNPGKLLMGGWGHCEPGTFDIFAEQLRFYDHYLKGVDNGIDREPHIYYYTIDAEPGQEWHFASAWPLPETQRTQLYLGPDLTGTDPGGAVASALDGSLGDKSLAGKDNYTVDYSVSCPVEPMFWPCVLDAKGMTYTGPLLQADLQVTGSAFVHLWVTGTTPDADIFGYLEDIAPDGKADIVTHGRIKISHRALSKARFATLDLPWHDDRESGYLPGPIDQPTEVVFDLLPTSKIFKAGHRLRLTITGADPRQRNLKEIMITPAPRIAVLRGGETASFLDLPVIPAGSAHKS